MLLEDLPSVDEDDMIGRKVVPGSYRNRGITRESTEIEITQFFGNKDKMWMEFFHAVGSRVFAVDIPRSGFGKGPVAR